MNVQTTSVSKGVFVFDKNVILPKINKPKQTNKTGRTVNYFIENLWYKAYSDLRDDIEEQLEELNTDMFSSVLKNFVSFVGTCNKTEFLQTAALLTGVNMPDHAAQFLALCRQIKTTVSPHVACLYNQDCQNLKNLVDNMINQFINNDRIEENDITDPPLHIKKSQMNISVLQCWYDYVYKENNLQTPKKLKTKKSEKSLVVIFPEFESLNLEVIQKFLLIASERIHQLPFVIVFGIATSTNILTNSLPHKVLSRMTIKVFHSQSSSVYLNRVLENIFFDLSYPFHLGGKVFNLFMDIFLFYDLSVNNFIQNIKFAMMEHFCHGDSMVLCNLDKRKTTELIKNFDHKSLENVRHLKSFRKLVENETCENKIKLLTDDIYFRDVLNHEVIKIQKYIRRLHLFLQCLLILVADLPKAPLGTQLREIYPLAVSKKICLTQEYKECFQLLNFQSKEKLTVKLKKIINFLSNHVKHSCNNNKLGDIINELKKYLDEIQSFNMDDLAEVVNDIDAEVDARFQASKGRKEFREKLISLSKHHNKSLSKYEKLRQNIVDYLSTLFEQYLIEPTSFPFYEIFFFDDISIQNYIVGTHRAAIHTALNDPYYYLQCNCCKISNSSAIKPLMPDICIAYKLHLECGKLINLYDWLQAFLSIVDTSREELEDDTKHVVDPKLQARFTQSVTELEFLGFIKSSKRKADHVSRLTWGG